ncbi:unnamed protein product [Cuscuta epithymum]|uniref:CCHC-type domain-containing protein n=1 Tax=Cuscuta epithymum TaxID=186058 RepID=A0AAV0DL10_9ASTE|nr:unnamed protein product [Cuscuta epithymum]
MCLMVLFMTLKTAQKIGNYLDKFVHLDENQIDGSCSVYLRIKISLDICEPLQKGTKIQKDNREFWVDFKYEKLPRFCFTCGIIGHTERYCPLAYGQGIKVLVKPFGPELRAGRGRFRPTWGKNGLFQEGDGNLGKDRSHRTCMGGRGRQNSYQDGRFNAGEQHMFPGNSKEDAGDQKRRRLWKNSWKRSKKGRRWI